MGDISAEDLGGFGDDDFVDDDFADDFGGIV